MPSFTLDSIDSEEINIFNPSNFIPLSKEDKLRLYQPWLNSLIIKVFRKRFGYKYLLEQLKSIWNLSEEVTLMNLGNDYYLIKLHFEHNYAKVLNGRPWFIGNHFFTIRQWEPKFNAQIAVCQKIVIWARFVLLPTEYFDPKIRKCS